MVGVYSGRRVVQAGTRQERQARQQVVVAAYVRGKSGTAKAAVQRRTRVAARQAAAATIAQTVQQARVRAGARCVCVCVCAWVCVVVWVCEVIELNRLITQADGKIMNYPHDDPTRSRGSEAR